MSIKEPMYNKSYRPQRSNSRSFSGRPQSRFNTKRRFTGQYIDENKFIRKAIASDQVEAYKSQNAFADFSINKILKDNILRKGYTTPTAIQDKTIPPSLEGKDIIGIANTGTGKTAAFLIPLIHKVTLHKYSRVLIVTPTRELALQIRQELIDFSRGLNQYSALCIGGANMGRQISDLRRNPHFVIGTPGRLKDMIERRHLNLSHFQSVVLDEADRMLDMGFIGDMKLLLAALPAERQTLFFSATMSPQVQYLTKTFLNDPVTISVKTQDTANVDQDVIRVRTGENKLEHLHDLLIQPEFNKVLIFGQTKHGVEGLTKELALRGFTAASIHGDKRQSQRQQALNNFKADEVQVLVATDVAARGLDIPNVSHVINYDLPSTYDDYVHRIGRTGRANNKGYALTFVTK
jgi:ATP-dependent RNA helicase RhlE